MAIGRRHGVDAFVFVVGVFAFAVASLSGRCRADLFSGNFLVLLHFYKVAVVTDFEQARRPDNE
jgi:hypothetical protein